MHKVIAGREAPRGLVRPRWKLGIWVAVWLSVTTAPCAHAMTGDVMSAGTHVLHTTLPAPPCSAIHGEPCNAAVPGGAFVQAGGLVGVREPSLDAQEWLPAITPGMLWSIAPPELGAPRAVVRLEDFTGLYLRILKFLE